MVRRLRSVLAVAALIASFLTAGSANAVPQVSVWCPVCRADLGSAPQQFAPLVAPSLWGLHRCRPETVRFAAGAAP